MCWRSMKNKRKWTVLSGLESPALSKLTDNCVKRATFEELKKEENDE